MLAAQKVFFPGIFPECVVQSRLILVVRAGYLQSLAARSGVLVHEISPSMLLSRANLGCIATVANIFSLLLKRCNCKTEAPCFSFFDSGCGFIMIVSLVLNCAQQLVSSVLRLRGDGDPHLSVSKRDRLVISWVSLDRQKPHVHNL